MMANLLFPTVVVSVLLHVSTASPINPTVNNRKFGNQVYRTDYMNGGMGENEMRNHFDFENNDHLDIGWIVVKHRDNDPNDGNKWNPMKWGRNNWNNKNQYLQINNGMYGYPHRSMGTYKNQYTGSDDWMNQYSGRFHGMNNNQYPGSSNGIFSNQYPMNNNGMYGYPHRSMGTAKNQYPGSDDWMNQYPGRFHGMNNNQYPGSSNGIFSNQYPERSYGNNQYPGNLWNPDYPTNRGIPHGSNEMGTPYGNSQNAHNSHASSGSLSNNRAKRVAIDENSKDSVEKSVENSSESPEDMTV